MVGCAKLVKNVGENELDKGLCGGVRGAGSDTKSESIVNGQNYVTVVVGCFWKWANDVEAPHGSWVKWRDGLELPKRW